MKLFLSCCIAATIGLCAFKIAPSSTTIDIECSEMGYMDIYLENECSSDVKVRIRGGGSTSEFTLDGGEKVRRPVKDGYEIYADGDKIHTVSSSDGGDTIVVCD